MEHSYSVLVRALRRFFPQREYREWITIEAEEDAEGDFWFRVHEGTEVEVFIIVGESGTAPKFLFKGDKLERPISSVAIADAQHRIFPCNWNVNHSVQQFMQVGAGGDGTLYAEDIARLDFCYMVGTHGWRLTGGDAIKGAYAFQVRWRRVYP